jgi:hypothetical protein
VLLMQLALVLAVIVVAGGAVWLFNSPEHVAQSADMARAVVGPGLVGAVEGLVFQTQDTMHQVQYQTTGQAPNSATVEWAAPAANIPNSANSQTDALAPTAVIPPTPSAADTPQGTTSVSTTVTTVAWVGFTFDHDGTPLLERTIIAPDPTRPYVRAALVRFDLTKVQLHLVAGTTEPKSPVVLVRPGKIPSSVVRNGLLLAAFNGGFKAANGEYGMAVDGMTLLPPKDGLATLALYRDGRVQLGEWGHQINETPDLVAFRQNCPLLVADGRPTEEANSDDEKLWGHTVKNKIATWRSGLGLSADGRYLIYAVGDGLTIPSLAQALASGGADRAMQLDINSFWTRFVTYASMNGTPLQAQKLLSGMQGNSYQFLAADTRDFFYVTRRNG